MSNVYQFFHTLPGGTAPVTPRSYIIERYTPSGVFIERLVQWDHDAGFLVGGPDGLSFVIETAGGARSGRGYITLTTDAPLQDIGHLTILVTLADFVHDGELHEFSTNTFFKVDFTFDLANEDLLTVYPLSPVLPDESWEPGALAPEYNFLNGRTISLWEWTWDVSSPLFSSSLPGGKWDFAREVGTRDMDVFIDTGVNLQTTDQYNLKSAKSSYMMGPRTNTQQADSIGVPGNTVFEATNVRHYNSGVSATDTGVLVFNRARGYSSTLNGYSTPSIWRSGAKLVVLARKTIDGKIYRICSLDMGRTWETSMAITVWESTAARPVSGCRRVSGVECSVAVWGEDGEYSLRFKRSEDGGATWPADEDATIIASLTKREAWTISEVGGILHIGTGSVLAYRTPFSGVLPEDWEAL